LLGPLVGPCWCFSYQKFLHFSPAKFSSCQLLQLDLGARFGARPPSFALINVLYNTFN
jgi:hypothetical protein